jgi:glycine dehydrogenase subunit 1
VKAGGSGRRLLVSRGLHPHSRQVLETLSSGIGVEIEEIPLRDGATDADALYESVDDDVCGVVVQQPNFLGAVEDVASLVEAADGAPTICACDPNTLGVLRAPGECGVAIAVGEGQPLGGHLSFGGPSFGFMCAQEAYLRKMPGRIVGETTDAAGRRGFVLTLQTREQHIRREKATSNITTAQTLNALGAIVYLTWLGRRGIVELGELLLQRTAHARTILCAIEGVEPVHVQPVVREFAVRLSAPVDRVIQRCRSQGVNPGYPLGSHYPEHGDGLLVAITEQRTAADIERLADVIADAIFRERPGIAA